MPHIVCELRVQTRTGLAITHGVLGAVALMDKIGKQLSFQAPWLGLTFKRRHNLNIERKVTKLNASSSACKT